MNHLHPIAGRAVDSGDMRSLNASLLLTLIWQERSISRAELARRTGMSRSTVSAIVDELMSRGLVRLGSAGVSRGGRPPTMVEFCNERFVFCGVEIGATHVTVVLTDAWGTVLVDEHHAFDTRSAPEATMALVERSLRSALARARMSADRLVGIGVAVPSPVDSEHPSTLSPLILPAWDGFDVPQRLRAAFGVPAILENDANAGALAERWWGAGREVENLTYIKLGTGVGGGHIIRGELFRGAQGTAGEIGHFAIDPQGPQCSCGLRGCLTMLIGTPALLDRARGHLGLAPDAPLTVDDILAAARRGDRRIGDLMDEVGELLGVAIAGMLNLLNPSVVVFGGAIAGLDGLLLDPLRASVRRRALFTSVANTRIAVSELGNRAIAIGAATLILDAALRDQTMFPTAVDDAA